MCTTIISKIILHVKNFTKNIQVAHIKTRHTVDILDP